MLPLLFDGDLSTVVKNELAAAQGNAAAQRSSPIFPNTAAADWRRMTGSSATL
jgi:hypothetical protein